MRNFIDKLKNTFTKYKKLIFNSLIFFGYIIALISLMVLIININIVAKTEDKIYSIYETDALSSDYDCILVLGAGIRADGSATPMLRDRLLTCITTSNEKPQVPILLSGDSEDISYTETVTMKNFLIENGIDESIIVCDGYGLSTYESIWRAKNIYGYNKVLIVSQKYHLHRAIYIAEKLGMKADGVDAALIEYSKQPYYSFREYFARLKDIIYSDTKPQPKYTKIWEEKYE